MCHTVYISWCNNLTFIVQDTRNSEVGWSCSFQITKFKPKDTTFVDSQRLLIQPLLKRNSRMCKQNRKILGLWTDIKEILQKRKAWDISDSWQIANLYCLLLMIRVPDQVPLRSQDLLVRLEFSSEVEHLPTNNLIIADIFSRHQITLASTNVID